MNEFEIRILDNLTHSEYNKIDDVVFPNMGFLLEGAYHEGFLSTAWKEEWEDYCKENPPGTDDFSYCDVMVRMYEKFKDMETQTLNSHTQEKIKFIMNHASELEGQDWTAIRRIHTKLKSKVEAKKEENDILGDVLYSYSGLIRKKLDLYDLKQLLKSYVGEKGLTYSSLRIEELLALIDSDIRQMSENMDVNKECIDGIKQLLENKLK